VTAETAPIPPATRAGEAIPQAFLFHILTAPAPSQPLGAWNLAGAEKVLVGRWPTPSSGQEAEPQPVLVRGDPHDIWMSARHARLVHTGRGWRIEDDRSKNGTFVNRVLAKRAGLEDGDVIEMGQTFFLFREAVPDVSVANGVPTDAAFQTNRPELARRFRELRMAAPKQLPVLITGETGTGKELVARAVHTLSGRKGPFVAVNCGAIAQTLAESELFGHRAGAFTGATENRAGLIRSAGGGTLFLDEIGDLPLSLQATLLRVLDHHEVLPVGSTAPVPVDFRVVVATHHDLRARVKEGRFRDDLLARLLGLELSLPPLRERREDMALIIGTLLRRQAGERRDRIHFDLAAARGLVAYHWPGNIRELAACLDTALALEVGDEVTSEFLPLALQEAARRGGTARSLPEPRRSAEELKEELVQLLQQHRGSVAAVARAMRKDRRQVRRWLAQFSLRSADFRSSS
jgi:sigma-54 dependent transcriptional regulator, acetoin dehydrogenase operon transcriptional activator AcoR